MKRTFTIIAIAIVILFAFVAAGISIESGTRTMTGKVIGIDIDQSGKGIAISSTAGGKEIVAGAIVNESTDVRVKGKKATLSDIKSGDRVSLTYAYENNDLYAKKITKR